MAEIVRTHFPDIEDKLLKSAMDVFYQIRAIKDVRKKPSTSKPQYHGVYQRVGCGEFADVFAHEVVGAVAVGLAVLDQRPPLRRFRRNSRL